MPLEVTHGDQMTIPITVQNLWKNQHKVKFVWAASVYGVNVANKNLQGATEEFDIDANSQKVVNIDFRPLRNDLYVPYEQRLTVSISAAIFIVYDDGKE